MPFLCHLLFVKQGSNPACLTTPKPRATTVPRELLLSALAWEAWEPDPEGALAMSKQLTDGFGRAVKPDGMAVGTCLSCKVNKHVNENALAAD